MIAAILADLQYVDKIKGTYPAVWECIVTFIAVMVSEIWDDNTPVHNVHVNGRLA